VYRIASRLALFFIALPLFLLLTAGIEDSVQRMLRGHDLLSNIYQQILSEYVEEIEADEILEAAVSGMLGRLDPYGEFIEERANSEVDILARGMYGGLGIKVNRRGKQHVVSYVYDEIRPLTSLRIGDILLRVDTTDLRNAEITDLRPLLRGEAGSRVRLLVRRPGSHDSLELSVMRRDISVDPLPYRTEIDNGILYLKMTRFTKSLIDSVHLALQVAFSGQPPSGIVLDLRDNPGGLLESAVHLVDHFVPAGTPIVEMRGRQASYARRYAARTDPIARDVRLAVLVNKRSASASEITAGALQDLDRAVVIGERTFGKGLVQTLVPLNYNAFLKLTTSRYYIPSGRYIQRLDYSANGKQGKQDVEERIFRTLRLSRPVRASNGIVPDIILDQDSLPPFLSYIRRQNAVFDFVVWYRNAHQAASVPSMDKHLRDLFRAHLDTLAYTEGYPLGAALQALGKEADRAGADDEMLARIAAIRADIDRHTDREFSLHWDRIRSMLEEEFIFQLYSDRMLTAHRLSKDDVIRKAIDVLQNQSSWEAALQHSVSIQQTADD
jgi:carboxyl-terminal processing protease